MPLIFSAAHLDPIHVLGVIPLGVWLGAIAWRAGSVWPAMFCHAVNNAVAVAAAAVQERSTLEFTWDPFSVTLLAVGAPAFLLALGILAFAPPLPKENGFQSVRRMNSVLHRSPRWVVTKGSIRFVHSFCVPRPVMRLAAA